MARAKRRRSVSRRDVLGMAAALGGAALTRPARAQDGGPALRIGTTLAELPTSSGAPDQGTEGLRFMGLTLYDGLVGWDLSRADRPASLRPGLALSWTVDPTDRTRWTFKLRPGVRFHDGSAFDADAVVWNFDKILNRSAPQFDPSQAAQAVWRIPFVASYRKLGADAVEIETKAPDSTLPYQLTSILMSSPARWHELGGNWQKFAATPSGTGPWTLESYASRQHAVLRRNTAYWDKTRVPRMERLVLLPIPDPATRTAALLSGQVDWVESPTPDTVAALRSAGMKVLTGKMPHSWPYTCNMTSSSPLADLRVRKALNLAVDRDGLVTLLNGLALPATGVVTPDNPWYGHPSFNIRYDPAAAKKLLAEAGHGPAHPLKLKFAISTSGSGQMYPLPMNEFVQQNFRDVGVDLELQVMEWQALRSLRDAGGARGPRAAGIDALNNSWNAMDPYAAFIWHVDSHLTPPNGMNWGFINDPVLDGLCDQAMSEFDLAKQNQILAKINERMVDQAVWIFVVHDVNPRATSPRVNGLVEAQSWFVDFSPVYMD